MLFEIVPDCAKDLRLSGVCHCSAPKFEATLKALGLRFLFSLRACERALSALLGFALRNAALEQSLSQCALLGFALRQHLLALRLNPPLHPLFLPPKLIPLESTLGGKGGGSVEVWKF